MVPWCNWIGIHSEILIDRKILTMMESPDCIYMFFGLSVLTHWGWDKTVSILQKTFPNHFLYDSQCSLIQISLKFVLKSPVDTKPSSVQIMIWHQIGSKPLFKPTMARFISTYASLGLNELIEHLYFSTCTDSIYSCVGRKHIFLSCSD